MIVTKDVNCKNIGAGNCTKVEEWGGGARLRKSCTLSSLLFGSRPDFADALYKEKGSSL